ncbi:DUF397 domain-containing protein [Nocardia macrotermitis]|uniref:DUF397 domain-containing protein n=1 Tax=Nocardia macrotermitis TaxID=2585198 RepID=A0A7K0D7E8_9NOCA|nr:DUF397 domain-containing protein [Nocardia macrotermitis]MQY21637.1 hypothetical protein [Nocardia macrotermitis]
MTVDLSGATWFKSTKSPSQDTCVEVAHLTDDMVGVRDSTNPTGPALVFPPTAWDAFTDALHSGHYDLP